MHPISAQRCPYVARLGAALLLLGACTPLTIPYASGDLDDAGELLSSDGGDTAARVDARDAAVWDGSSSDTARDGGPAAATFAPDSGVASEMNDAGSLGSSQSPDATSPSSVPDAASSPSSSPDSSTAPADAGPSTPRVPAPNSTGPHAVSNYIDGYRDGPDFGAGTIYYPTDTSGPLPFLAIVPAFVSTQSSVQAWGPFLASYGFVVMTIDTNSTSDGVDARKAALLDALTTIRGEQTRSGSLLKAKLDLARAAVMGWSMGGGAALSAANDHPELKAVIGLCPWNPGVSYPSLSVPSLFLAAQNDELAPGQSTTFYDSMSPGTPRLLWERMGADHFANNDPAQEGGAVGRFGVSWLKVFLQGDERYREFLIAMPPSASSYKSSLPY